MLLYPLKESDQILQFSQSRGAIGARDHCPIDGPFTFLHLLPSWQEVLLDTI